MIGITIGVGEKYKFYAEKAAEAFSENTGMPVVIIGDDYLDKYAEEMSKQVIYHSQERAAYLKYNIFDAFPEENSFVYFDCDWTCVSKWDPLEFDNQKEFICVRDRIHYGEVRRQAKVLGMEPDNYFNSGFFIVNRENHKDIFDECRTRHSFINRKWADQCVFNQVLSERKFPMRFLSKRYNWADYRDESKHMNIIATHDVSNYNVYNGTSELPHIPLPEWEWDEERMAKDVEHMPKGWYADGMSEHVGYWCYTKDGQRHETPAWN